jgi:hypothetical protein
MHPSLFRGSFNGLLALLLVFTLNLTHSRAQAPAQPAAPELHLLALGDFGTADAGQEAVAHAMSDFVTQRHVRPDAMLMLGDNFYGESWFGFTVNSWRWKTTIENMYPASVFNCPMYAVLGNHDYQDNEGGQDVEIAYSQKPGVRWNMPGKWYRRDMGPHLTILFLDSNLPVDKKDKDGRLRPSLTQEEAAQEMTWLKTELSKPRGTFTLVVAHNPLYSNGDHGDNKLLTAAWEPLFQAHKVHAYLCGHDHDLQHLEIQGRFTSYIVSGGGGAETRKLEHPERPIPFGRDVHGFTHITVKADALDIAHHDVNGLLLHEFIKRPDGRVENLH